MVRPSLLKGQQSPPYPAVVQTPFVWFLVDSGSEWTYRLPLPFQVDGRVSSRENVVRREFSKGFSFNDIDVSPLKLSYTRSPFCLRIEMDQEVDPLLVGLPLPVLWSHS